MKKYPLEINATHLRVRQVPPIEGAKYRNQRVGEKGHSERIAMYNPKTKRWITQSWIFPIADVLSRRPSTVKILKRLGRWEEAYKFVKKEMHGRKRAPIAQPIKEPQSEVGKPADKPIHEQTGTPEHKTTSEEINTMNRIVTGEEPTRSELNKTYKHIIKQGQQKNDYTNHTQENKQ